MNYLLQNFPPSYAAVSKGITRWQAVSAAIQQLPEIDSHSNVLRSLALIDEFLSEKPKVWQDGISYLATDLVATRKCLNQAGFRELQEQDVVVVPVEDEPGAAAGVFQRIANAHINVRYSYLATGNRLVISAADPQAVIKALQH